jgi:hypothetical protein
MKAIYENRIYNVADVAGDLILEGDGKREFAVNFGDDQLIVDPTDEQVADASNLAEWYCVDSEGAKQLRSMLLGEISIGEWRDWKERRR